VQKRENIIVEQDVLMFQNQMKLEDLVVVVVVCVSSCLKLVNSFESLTF